MKLSFEDLAKKVNISKVNYSISYRGQTLAENLAESDNFWKRLFCTDKFRFKSMIVGYKAGKPTLELIFIPEEPCRIDTIEVWCIQEEKMWTGKVQRNFPDYSRKT